MGPPQESCGGPKSITGPGEPVEMPAQLYSNSGGADESASLALDRVRAFIDIVDQY
jgi:hypothetical protein